MGAAVLSNGEMEFEMRSLRMHHHVGNSDDDEKKEEKPMHLLQSLEERKVNVSNASISPKSDVVSMYDSYNHVPIDIVDHCNDKIIDEKEQEFDLLDISKIVLDNDSDNAVGSDMDLENESVSDIE